MMELGLVVFNCTIFILLAGLHVYWLCDGRWGLGASVPTDSNGRKLFRPSRTATLVVAIGLLLFALCNMAVVGWLGSSLHPTYIRYGILIIAIIFLLRAVGDFRYIGITKRHRQSYFARLDTRLYIPLCLALVITHGLIYLR